MLATRGAEQELALLCLVPSSTREGVRFQAPLCRAKDLPLILAAWRSCCKVTPQPGACAELPEPSLTVSLPHPGGTEVWDPKQDLGLFGPVAARRVWSLAPVQEGE